MGSIVWAQGLTQAVIATSSMEWNGKQCKEYPTATYLTPILVERERERELSCTRVPLIHPNIKAPK